ncbi:alpha/beta fold hydrolase [Dermatobacter hominis]|uniref:alpha/beta fold hydrolase n=1 Tax=Dermatobacter hominis TaxID=2884263 RepID=UPI001D12AE55|nr:alpha/beta fold hydrolase [Dermatobacter hominis]UDY36007.1 alpha/beta fold hydrolase [Dermatobacter hominis]
MPDPNGTPRSSVVMLHGFTQTGGCLGPVADALAPTHSVLRPDLPGHGDATRLAGKDLWATASHLATAIGPTLDGPSVWFGYSFGGRVALHVALAHPEVVSGLVLVGATAGIRDDAERAERAARDRELADHVEAVGVDRFLDEWLAGPLFAGLPEWARFAEERRRNTAAGLAGSLRHAGTGSMAPLWDRLDEITVPVLCLSGERDPKFTALAEELGRALPAAEVAVVTDAGHAAHLEQPDAVAQAMLPFCDRLVPLTAARQLDPAPRWYA